MGGDGSASDATDSLYFVTGDGPFDGSPQLGRQLHQDVDQRRVSDSFTPFNQAALDSANHDLGSGGALLLPGPARHPPARDGQLREGRDDLPRRPRQHGQVQHDDEQHRPDAGEHLPAERPAGLGTGQLQRADLPQRHTSTSSPTATTCRASPSRTGCSRRRPRCGPRRSSPTAAAPWRRRRTGRPPGSSGRFSGTGRIPACSTPTTASSSSGTLSELYDSSQAGSRDTLDVAAKFNPPLIANGNVFVAGTTQLTAYGLLP